MATDQDVAVAVDLEQVSVEGVEPETPDRKGVIVLEIENGFWITQFNEPFLEQVESQNLK